jgi:hypothetical protein
LFCERFYLLLNELGIGPERPKEKQENEGMQAGEQLDVAIQSQAPNNNAQGDGRAKGEGSEGVEGMAYHSPLIALLQSGAEFVGDVLQVDRYCRFISPFVLCPCRRILSLSKALMCCKAMAKASTSQ